jgi:cellulose 1,4-beta-cellobiosidase
MLRTLLGAALLRAGHAMNSCTGGDPFPIDFNGTQCKGLQGPQLGITSAEACRDACCGYANCKVWQFCAPGASCQANSCWLGSSTSNCGTANLAWVGAGRTDVPTVANPFQNPPGGGYYVNPANAAELEASAASLPKGDAVRVTLETMATVASAYWIDTKAKIAAIAGTNATDTVEEILADAAAQVPAPLVVFIVYDAPNRDCAAKASNGEICCTYSADGTCDYTAGGDCAAGLAEYQDEYIGPFAQVRARCPPPRSRR